MILLLLISALCGVSCNLPSTGQVTESDSLGVTLVVLGTTQDAGLPHIGCRKECCRTFFRLGNSPHTVVSLGVVDHVDRKKYLLEATPDISKQVKLLKEAGCDSTEETPDGIFLTHAHIGHYAGLMYLGKEALGAKNVPVYAMPRMKDFLESNGPWSQLVSDKNIDLHDLAHEEPIVLSNRLKIIPFTVPHRDEFSETVGYKIIGPNKSALFIPDINKWDIWEKDITEEIQKVDYAFLDATFFNAAEINHRDISEIPHPFVSESMEKFSALSQAEKQKVIFIHLNHTNPLLRKDSEEYQEVLRQGYRIADARMVFEL